MKLIKIKQTIPIRKSDKTPSGRIWPCQEFSLGYVTPRPDDRLDERELEYCAPGDEGSEASPSPLDLRNVPNSDNAPRCPLVAGPEGAKVSKRPERYGRKGITGYGKKMVKSVGALIDRHYPHHRITFATITMPSLPKQLRVELAQTWPKLVNELMKWLCRRLEKKGLPKVVVSVTEIQPKRLEESGEGYLHLHLLWMNPPQASGGWSIRVENLRSWVADWLIRKNLWAQDSHINVDTRSVKGEKARYLAKYASKGVTEIEAFAEDCGWESVPSQWWNCTNTARRWVKDHIVEGRTAGELLDHFVSQVFESGDFSDLHYIYQVEIELDGKWLNVGWRGGLTSDGYNSLLDAISIA